ncbi:MAG: hypothetical protein R2710_07210 [Acidimicrobiales bacterium]
MVCVLFAAACTGGSSDAASEGSDEAALSLGATGDELAADLEQHDDIDGVIRMLPPTGAPLRDSPMGPKATLVGQRAVLSIATPNGPVQMYEVRVSDPEMGPGPQLCMVITETNGMSASCGAIGDAGVQGVGHAGASGSDTGSIYELAGPIDMTHFVADVEGRRLAVMTTEGRRCSLSSGRSVRSHPRW